MLKLIGDVLDFSKMETGDIDLFPTWFSLPELVGECISEYRGAVAAGVELRTVCSCEGCIVELDSSRVKQILNNLLSNALKNTVSGYVEVACELDDGGLELRVTDTGCGIPQDKLDRIFERFEKVDSFVQGAGLGLSICKSIVEKMGGEIGVESQVGRGSTFRVKLPCAWKSAGD